MLNYKQNWKSEFYRKLGSVVVLQESSLRVSGSDPIWIDSILPLKNFCSKIEFLLKNWISAQIELKKEKIHVKFM
jgi:hypothetical protein